MVSEAQPTAREVRVERYRAIRAQTVGLCHPLAAEDYVVQSIPEASPPKWHLAHTTWFFETFVLRAFVAGYVPLDPRYESFFNSYYVSVSDLVPQGSRGTFSRPTVKQVLAYRAHVDRAIETWLLGELSREQAHVLEVGLQHEQQHQELLLMDIKSHLLQPPFFPAYHDLTIPPSAATPLTWTAFAEEMVEIGHDGEGFGWDNEFPRHRAFLHAFELADRPVSNGEWLEFMEAGGYDDPSLWLSDGWAHVTRHGWRAPEYWHETDDGWERFTLSGSVPVELAAPVCHVSYYEAEAYARFRGARLPTEQEWELAATRTPDAPEGAFMDAGHYDPVATSGSGLRELAGNVWEWTASDYAPYPGYAQPKSALGEYNGKFMANQRVLRGGGCATPRAHYRPSYRNFFYPHHRWPFTGVRLAR